MKTFFVDRPRLPIPIQCGLLFCVLATAQPVAAANYQVTTTADGGSGSLRQAILDANANPGLDTITFAIVGVPPFTITPASALPSVTDPVIIDGTSQTGYAGLPLIEIDGANLPGGSDGLNISAGGSTVLGLAINRCPRDGIRLQSLGTNVIQGNFLGTDPTGAISLGNGEGGVMVYGSPGNLIGGTNSAQRNLLSGDNQSGVFLFLSSAVGNVVSGNYVGTSVSGLTSLGNIFSGVVIAGSSSNLIGGTNPGAGNLISGNGQSGVYILQAPATGNLIEGNYIGVDATGLVALHNFQDGVTIDATSGNTVGGTTSGARNILSGNLESGVFIWTAGANSNIVLGNYIGTDVTGTNALPNMTNGVTIDGTSGNTIGGTVPGSENVISGNQQDGILILSSGATNNTVAGNYIGPDATGKNALGNAWGGVTIEGVSDNMIGAVGGGNVISGNYSNGVLLINDGATNNLITYNFIGTDVTGERAMANSLAGIYIEASGNTIGGATAGAGNVISGNTDNGIFIYDSSTSNNVVGGNFIGTDAGGTVALPNGFFGVSVSNAPANVIGRGNVISGNVDGGIALGGNTSGTVVQGNFIGTDLTGNLAVPNSAGIYFFGAGSNLIGGTTPGSGNVISGNNGEGLSVANPGANGNTIQGNFIGTKADGVSPLGNLWHNIDIQNTAANNLVGGATAAADNHLAFVRTAQYDGVRIRAGCIGNYVGRNSIFSNAGWGIVIGNSGVTDTNLVTLSQAVSDGNETVVHGAMATYPNGQFQVQVYENIVPDLTTPPGYGEGLIYLGATNIAIDSSGNASFEMTLPGTAQGRYLSATATDASGTTWEFGVDTLIGGLPSLTIHESGSSAAAVVTIAWSNAAQFGLEYTTSLVPPITWTAATNPIVTSGGTNSVSLSPQGKTAFYRLFFQ